MSLPISPDSRRSEYRQRTGNQVILLGVELAIVVTGRLVNISSSGFCVRHVYPGFTPGQALHLCQAGRDIQSKTFNSSALTLAAILFLVLTIPLARLVDWLIARQQAKTQRGGPPTGGDEEGLSPAVLQPLPTAGGGAAGV